MNWRKQIDDFKTGLRIDAPVISTSAIRFAFFGTVGAGKSVTAGIFAVGITPEGLIGWVDGEGQRSGWAIDIVADMAAKHYGGTKEQWKKRFLVIHLDPPFNPLRVVAATEALEEAGCKTIIEDVMSQAWDSDGGYLDLKSEELDRMAGDDDRKRERSAASAAAHIKPWTHQKLVNKINSSKSNIVMLFQAKQKYNPKTFKPDDFQTPIQESGLTRTAIAVGRVECDEKGDGGHCLFQLPLNQGTKFTHPSILAALPRNGEQFKFQHAEAILKLCGGKPLSQGDALPVQGSNANNAVDRAAASSSKVATEATRTWMLGKLADILPRMLAWSIDKGILMPDESLEAFPLSRVPTNAKDLAAIRIEIEAHV